MRLIMLGAPGAGKGTQAKILSKKLSVPHISTGDIFRANIKNETELGILAKTYIDAGKLVPDETTIGIVKNRLLESDCASGFILDGFPRTLAQAMSLDETLANMGMELTGVVNIEVDDEKIIKRMQGRRVCPNCGASYHQTNNPSKNGTNCDHCSTELIIRDDDKPETVISRLETYHKQTEPLIKYYNNKKLLVAVDGWQEVESITNEILSALGV